MGDGCRGAGQVREHSSSVVSAAVAFFALYATAGISCLGVAGARRLALHIPAEIGVLRSRCTPRRNLPHHTREAFQLETFAVPFTAWLPCPVQCSKVGIDGTLIGLGPQLVMRDGSDASECSIGVSVRAHAFLGTRFAPWLGYAIRVNTRCRSLEASWFRSRNAFAFGDTSSRR